MKSEDITDLTRKLRRQQRAGVVLTTLSVLQFLLAVATLSITSAVAALLGLLSGVKCAQGLPVSRISLPCYCYAFVNGGMLLITLLVALIAHFAVSDWCSIGKLQEWKSCQDFKVAVYYLYASCIAAQVNFLLKTPVIITPVSIRVITVFCASRFALLPCQVLGEICVVILLAELGKAGREDAKAAAREAWFTRRKHDDPPDPRRGVARGFSMSFVQSPMGKPEDPAVISSVEPAGSVDINTAMQVPPMTEGVGKEGGRELAAMDGHTL